MNLDYKIISGFKFVKVGDFYINEKPFRVTYQKQETQVIVSLQLVDDLFKKADESPYLIFINNEDSPVYVGEYSYNLTDRWLRKSVYVWHNKETEIESELKKNNKVSLWLAVNPYFSVAENKSINISKSIEQDILREIYPKWNIRGQLKKYSKWREKNCIRVSEIISEINKIPTSQ